MLFNNYTRGRWDKPSFLDIATGFPGSCHDAQNLRNSSLFRRAQNNELLIKPTDVVENSEIRPLLLGDGVYPRLLG